jgi:hypothetical protein
LAHARGLLLARAGFPAQSAQVNLSGAPVPAPTSSPLLKLILEAIEVRPNSNPRPSTSPQKECLPAPACLGCDRARQLQRKSSNPGSCPPLHSSPPSLCQVARAYSFVQEARLVNVAASHSHCIFRRRIITYRWHAQKPPREPRLPSASAGKIP